MEFFYSPKVVEKPSVNFGNLIRAYLTEPDVSGSLLRSSNSDRSVPSQYYTVRCDYVAHWPILDRDSFAVRKR